jgi:hypothetical protein
MLNKLKVLLIATIVAGSASTAFAANDYEGDHNRPEKIQRHSDTQLFERRNSAPQWDYSTNGTSTSRDAMVQELGN